MKVFVAVLAIALAAQAAVIDDEWLQFKKNHKKVYGSASEEQQRFKVFQNNLNKITEHNKKYDNGEETYFMAVNEYSDMTWEEFKQHFGIRPMQPPKLFNATMWKVIGDSPATFDWRDRDGITGVKNQGGCGSCWAFATIGSLESRYFIVHGQQKISLSEQQLVDCSRNYGSAGCNGGWMTEGYDYIRDNDINRDSDYPYAGVDQNCRADAAHNVNIKLTGYFQSQQGDEMALQDAVYWHGAMAVAIDVTDNFQSYGGGVFTDGSCSADTLNHGVTITGYGRENDQDYWNVKNSWGGGWGEGGYIRMRRKDGNRCGIAQFPYSPNIDA